MANAALFERRLFLGFTALTLLGYLFEIIAVSTDHWLLLTMNNGMVKIYSGFWRICNVTTTKVGDATTEGELRHRVFPHKNKCILRKFVTVNMHYNFQYNPSLTISFHPVIFLHILKKCIGSQAGDSQCLCL